MTRNATSAPRIADAEKNGARKTRMIASKMPMPPGTFDATPAICASRKMPRKRPNVSGSESGSRM